MPERKLFPNPLPKILPVSSLSATLEHFERESVLKASSLGTKNSRWNTFVNFCLLKGITYKSIFPEDLLAFATYLLESSPVQKTDDYVVCARQRLPAMKGMELDSGSKEFYEEVGRPRLKLANKNYSPLSAPPFSDYQIRTFLT